MKIRWILAGFFVWAAMMVGCAQGGVLNNPLGGAAAQVDVSSLIGDVGGSLLWVDGAFFTNTSPTVWTGVDTGYENAVRYAGDGVWLYSHLGTYDRARGGTNIPPATGWINELDEPVSRQVEFIGAGAVALALPKFPVFVIDMDGGYCEVELKASVNNFEGEPLYYGCDYWAESLGNEETNSMSSVSADWLGATNADFGCRFYYTVPGNGYTGGAGGTNDCRHVFSKPVDQSITSFSGLTNMVSVMVCPSRVTQAGVCEWMRPDNPDIRWVYRRRDAVTGGEGGDDAPRWHVVEPVTWTWVQK